MSTGFFYFFSIFLYFIPYCFPTLHERPLVQLVEEVALPVVAVGDRLNPDLVLRDPVVDLTYSHD